MTATESASRLGPYVERLLQNAYVQDNLLDAVENLREAYERAQKRRVEPARDEKIRRQLRQSVLSLQKAGEALKSGRQKPKKRRAKRMLDPRQSRRCRSGRCLSSQRGAPKQAVRFGWTGRRRCSSCRFPVRRLGPEP